MKRILMIIACVFCFYRSLSPSQPSVLFISLLLSLSLPIPPPSYSLITSLLLYPSIPELCKIGYRRLSAIVPGVLCCLNEQPCSDTLLDSLSGNLAVNQTATVPVSAVALLLLQQLLHPHCLLTISSTSHTAPANRS